jgi:hypothetical protein
MRLLYVESNEFFAKLLSDRMWRWIGAEWRVHRVPGAYEALDYLSGFGQYANRARFPFPDLMVLSLSAQTTDGADLLAWLRGNAWLRGKEKLPYLPVVVFRTAETDTLGAQELAPGAWFAQMAELKLAVSLCAQGLTSPLFRLPRPESEPHHNEALAA